MAIKKIILVTAIPDLFRPCSARNRTEPIVVFPQRRFYSILIDVSDNETSAAWLLFDLSYL
jgi:hypothetical protein